MYLSQTSDEVRNGGSNFTDRQPVRMSRVSTSNSNDSSDISPESYQPEYGSVYPWLNSTRNAFDTQQDTKLVEDDRHYDISPSISPSADAPEVNEGDHFYIPIIAKIRADLDFYATQHGSGWRASDGLEGRQRVPTRTPRYKYAGETDERQISDQPRAFQQMSLSGAFAYSSTSKHDRLAANDLTPNSHDVRPQVLNLPTYDQKQSEDWLPKSATGPFSKLSKGQILALDKYRKEKLADEFKRNDYLCSLKSSVNTWAGLQLVFKELVAGHANVWPIDTEISRLTFHWVPYAQTPIDRPDTTQRNFAFADVCVQHLMNSLRSMGPTQARAAIRVDVDVGIDIRGYGDDVERINWSVAFHRHNPNSPARALTTPHPSSNIGNPPERQPPAPFTPIPNTGAGAGFDVPHMAAGGSRVRFGPEHPETSRLSPIPNRPIPRSETTMLSNERVKQHKENEARHRRRSIGGFVMDRVRTLRSPKKERNSLLKAVLADMDHEPSAAATEAESSDQASSVIVSRVMHHSTHGRFNALTGSYRSATELHPHSIKKPTAPDNPYDFF